jgi:transcriptional regulator with PAS, ATPase and Fis domain
LKEAGPLVPSEVKVAESRCSDQSSLALVGEHPTILRLRKLIGRVAPADVTVLVTGESGTGKEVVARMIHSLSGRRGRAFVPVNCAAIPSELLESEMFGHERGAFTGAAAPRQGLFSSADGGTMFLDEVNELSLQLQAKLLRVLEDRMVRPLGSDHAARVDARVIAASNQDLAMLVQNHTFREDLFYRLQVVPIIIPPLRERRSDIPILIEHFLDRIRARFDRKLAVSREAMVHLWSYNWPGNIRELENIVERLAILCEDATIDVKHLPPDLITGARIAEPRIELSLENGAVNLNAMVRELEGRLINQALRRTGGNKKAAARLLGLKRTTFAAKLRRCGVIATADSGDRPDREPGTGEDEQAP